MAVKDVDAVSLGTAAAKPAVAAQKPDAGTAPTATSQGGVCFSIEPWKVAILGPFVDFVGLGTIMPLIPFFCQAVDAPQVWIGAILSAQYAGVVVGSVFWGRTADYMGVRKVFMILLMLDVVFFAASGIVTSALALLLIRFGAGFCALMPLGTAWISSSAPPEKQMRAFTLLVVSVLGGIILGSAVGGTVSQIKSGVGVGDGGWFSAMAFSSLLVLVVLVLALLGTSDPPARPKGEAPPKPEGVREATRNRRFLAVCLTSFLGANEGGVCSAFSMTVLTMAKPAGYAYTQALVGIVFVVIGSILLFSSVCFADWLAKHTEPLQRICVLGVCTSSLLLLHVAFGVSLQIHGGTWDFGDVVFLTMNMSLFIFQCVVGPTAMAIAAIIATAKARNAHGTIMGMQQMVMNTGQAVGPMLGSALLSVNYFLPFAYLLLAELLVLALNLSIFSEAKRNGELMRNLFDLSAIRPPQQAEANADDPEAVKAVDVTADAADAPSSL